MPNPYDPQKPAKPDYFGGRDAVLQIVLERIERACVQKQPGGILIYGHRGVGKTSLLKKIISLASTTDGTTPSNGIIIYRRLSRTTTDNDLYQILNEELFQQVTERKNILQKIKDAAQRLESVKVFEIEVSVQTQEFKQSHYLIWKRAAKSLQNAEFVLIAIDDADYLSTEALSELKTIVEDSSGTPIVLVVSGGVQFESRLVDEFSPVARIFSGASLNLSEFSLKETEEVLTKPLKGQKTSWNQAAVYELHKFTKGYPYLVQCLACAAYRENAGISADDVRTAVPRAIEIGKGWLDHEIPNASDEDVRSFSKVAEVNKETLRSQEMSRLGVSAPYIGRLVKLGVLKQIRRGKYILQKSPLIATYEMLKRRLPIEV